MEKEDNIKSNKIDISNIKSIKIGKKRFGLGGNFTITEDLPLNMRV